MSTIPRSRSISAMTAVADADFTDAATQECVDASGNTRKNTIAQTRTRVNTGPQAFVASTAGVATTLNRITKAVTAIADATATAVLTVTVPNAAHASSLRITVQGSLGAGGAIGANEAVGTVTYDVSIARTAGVNVVAVISSAYGSAMANVAGAATITVTCDLGAVSGAVGAVNTFTIRTTITKGSGSSANHTAMVVAELRNANATGCTMA